MEDEKVYPAVPGAVMMSVGNNFLLAFAGLVFLGIAVGLVFGQARQGLATGAWPALAFLAVGGGLALVRFLPRLRRGFGTYEVRLSPSAIQKTEGRVVTFLPVPEIREVRLQRHIFRGRYTLPYPVLHLRTGGGAEMTFDISYRDGRRAWLGMFDTRAILQDLIPLFPLTADIPPEVYFFADNGEIDLEKLPGA
jgi:hypothetical protein